MARLQGTAGGEFETLKVTGSISEATLQTGIYDPILDLLAEPPERRQGPPTIEENLAELESRPTAVVEQPLATLKALQIG